MTSHQGHHDVARALVEAGNAVLGHGHSTDDASDAASLPSDAEAPAAPVAQVAAAPAPSMGEQLRELAQLHQDGILSEEEFGAAKKSLLGIA